ncbi:MAG: ABC transporter ATP-binding protein [Actinomycetota bacterium]
MESTIRLRGVTKRYDPDPQARPAVDGIDLDIGPGEIVALLGPNGAGKTTTLDMVLGFVAPTAGGVQVLGGAPADAVAAGRVSAVLQTGGLLRDLRVRETVELIASTYTDPPAVDDVLARAGLTEIAGRKVQGCSGGEQQRLRFALALLAEPELLILDEPTAGMDIAGRQDFWRTMQDEAAQGRTIVFATHYLEEAEAFARRTVLLARGRVVADGPTEVVRNRVSGRLVRATVPAANQVEVLRHLDRLPEITRVDLTGDRVEVETSDSDAVARYLLGTVGGHDLEIDAASLEQAFLALTGDGSGGDTAADPTDHTAQHQGV